MKTTMILLGSVLALSAGAAQALFVSSDFELTVTGRDSIPPHVNLSGFGTGYEFYLTNLSDQTATFGTNIFHTGGAGPDLFLNGVNIFDSPHFVSWFNPVGPDPANASLAPGETLYFGGFAVYLDFFTVPNVSTVIFNDYVQSFRNAPGGDTFYIGYDGPPVVNTLVTPVPAVGYGLLPMLLLMRRMLRRPI